VAPSCELADKTQNLCLFLPVHVLCLLLPVHGDKRLTGSTVVDRHLPFLHKSNELICIISQARFNSFMFQAICPPRITSCHDSANSADRHSLVWRYRKLPCCTHLSPALYYHWYQYRRIGSLTQYSSSERTDGLCLIQRVSYLQALVACNLIYCIIQGCTSITSQHWLDPIRSSVSCSHSTTNPFCSVSHTQIYLTHGGIRITAVVVTVSSFILICSLLLSLLFCPLHSSSDIMFDYIIIGAGISRLTPDHQCTNL